MSLCLKSLIKNMNLVVGCTIGCPYCYARINCRRFHLTDDFSVPVFEEQKLHIIDTKKPHDYLLTGLSDFSDWKPEWNRKVFDRIAENPQHRYLFLTKRPELIDFSSELDTVWMGVTVTRVSEKDRLSKLRQNIRAGHYYAGFEPLFEPLGELDFTGIEWIVIGTETGKRKGKVDSRPEWVLDITRQAHEQGTRVFMKEDLLPIMGEERMVQELPPEFICSGEKIYG